LKPLRIGTRASALARWQAESVQAQLAALGCVAALVLIRTSGDQDRQTPLRLLGGKGVFTKEIETALLEKRVDLAVHSMKDVPTFFPDGLHLSCITKREDARDALLSRPWEPGIVLTMLERAMLASLARGWQAELAADSATSQRDRNLIDRVTSILAGRPARASWLEDGIAPATQEADYALLLPPAAVDAGASTWVVDAARHEAALRSGSPPRHS